ncbi:MAG: tetratricopeptide repeat protein, partial [Pseudomonadota bacterium]
TRAQESSADQAAVTYLERIGESPAGIVEFFEEFRYQEVLSQARRFEYFRTHPLASDRIRALRSRAEETGLWDVPATDRALRQMDMMHAKLIGFLEPPVKVYQRYPLSDTSEPARYARAISALQSVDIQTALAEIDALIEVDPDNPYYHELKGQILFENGRVAESVGPHERSVELLPEQPLLLINLARSMVARGEEGDVEAGENALRRALLAEPDNAFAWSELAKALDKQGRRAEAELATAERSFHIGDYIGAQTFSQRAIGNLEPGSTLYRRATDIAAVTDPRLEENRRYYRRR